MKTQRPAYADDDVSALVAILARQTTIAIDAKALVEALMDLMAAVGRATEERPEWPEFPKVSERPNNAAVAATFRAIAAAPDPFAPGIMEGEERARLRALAHGRWPPRRLRAGAGQDRSSERDPCLALLRQLALQVARYHQGFVRRGAPTKSDQETILLELADIYCRFAGLSCGRYELPHAVNSRFIAFAHIAMRPFFDQTEVTPKALSHCWKKLKDQHLAGAPRCD